MICAKHKTYGAKRKSKTGCLVCWEMWFKRHSGKNITGEDIDSILSAIDIELEEAMEQSRLINDRLKKLSKMHDSLQNKFDQSMVA